LKHNSTSQALTLTQKGKTLPSLWALFLCLSKQQLCFEKAWGSCKDFKNYQPISNLPFIAKLLERTVAKQLQEYLNCHGFWEKFQFSFRAMHSTDTALVKVVNDLLLAADSGHVSILILLDLMAAFDTVCHNHLLSFGVLAWYPWCPTVLVQIISTDRQQFVSIGNFRSPNSPLLHGVPQGSVLGPLLLKMYILPFGQIIQHYGINYHCYADDTQSYIHTNPTDILSLSNLVSCLNAKNWMIQNFLKLNQDKTEAILIFTPNI